MSKKLYTCVKQSLFSKTVLNTFFSLFFILFATQVWAHPYYTVLSTGGGSIVLRSNTCVMTTTVTCIEPTDAFPLIGMQYYWNGSHFENITNSSYQNTGGTPVSCPNTPACSDIPWPIPGGGYCEGEEAPAQLAFWRLNNYDDNGCGSASGLISPGRSPYQTASNVWVGNLHRQAGSSNCFATGDFTNTHWHHMGIDVPTDPNFQNNSPYALRWPMHFPSFGEISSVRFYHGSVRNTCEWFAGGCTGFNNLPNKVGLRITDQNGVEIFKEVDIQVTTCWKWTYIDIGHTVLSGGTYTFELLAYGAAASGGCCNYWNISELYVDGCRDENSCTMNGAGLTDVSCMPTSAINFNLNPGITNPGGTTYSVSISGGGATSISPTIGVYGQPTNFTLNNNSAGGGDVTITIRNIGNGCYQDIVIPDPGACVSPCDNQIDITSHPQNQIFCGGNSPTMCVTATGTDLSYQWEYSWNGAISGGNAGEDGSTTECISNFPASAAGAYFRVRITDANGCVVYSNWARLTTDPELICEYQINDEAWITDDCDIELCEYNKLVLRMTSSDDNTVWTRPDGSTYTGAELLVGNNISSNDAGTYTANICGYTTDFNLTVINGINITSPPQNQSFCPGQTPSICVAATGTDLSYQWEYSWDGVNSGGNAGESGNTTACLSNFPQAAVGAYFRVRITDANGCVVYSDWARLTQGVEPDFECQYNIDGTGWVTGDCSILLCEGQSLRYSYPGCNANWQIDLIGPNGFSVFETGGCGDLLVTNSATTSLSGTYTATITDINTGCSSSQQVEITVVDELVAVTLGGGLTNCGPFDPPLNDNIGFASGCFGGTITNQWQISTASNGWTWTDVSGATGTTWNVPFITETTRVRRGDYCAPCGNWIYTNDIEYTISSAPSLTCLHNVNNNTSGPISEHWNFGNCKPIVCEGDMVRLSVLPDGAGTYEWSGPNGFSGTGNVNGDILISNSITPDQAGIYSVVLTDNNGCSSTKSIELIISSCFCIDEGGDADGDGICGDIDCEPNNPNIPAAPGTACDDGIPSNINDLIQANGCDCIGELCDIVADLSPPVYNDNGTPEILTDDTFTFQLTVNGSGTNWLSENHSGLYGETVVLGPYPVDQSGTIANIRDAQNQNCQVSVGANMSSCIYTGDCTCCED